MEKFGVEFETHRNTVQTDQFIISVFAPRRSAQSVIKKQGALMKNVKSIQMEFLRLSKLL